MDTDEAADEAEQRYHDIGEGERPSDPWHGESSGGGDPWGGYQHPSSGPGAGKGKAFRHSENFPMGVSPHEPPPQRFIHDQPPTWDGQDPTNQAEPYLKLLAGWLATTRTQKTQVGMTILQYATGDLRTIINGFDIDQLTGEGSGKLILDLITEEFREYLDKKLPIALERALFSHEGRRVKGESLLQYIARKKTLFKDLAKAKCELPSLALEYILQRDALLPERATETMETWNQGSYEYELRRPCENWNALSPGKANAKFCRYISMRKAT